MGFLQFIQFIFVTKNSCRVVVFSLKPSFKKCFCRNMGVLKIKQKLVYELYEYSKLKIMIKKKWSMLLDRIPLPVKIIHSKIQHCKKQFIEMIQCYLVYINPSSTTSIMSSWYVSPPILV